MSRILRQLVWPDALDRNKLRKSALAFLQSHFISIEMCDSCAVVLRFHIFPLWSCKYSTGFEFTQFYKASSKYTFQYFPANNEVVEFDVRG